MSKIKSLFEMCLNDDLNVSLTWQKMTGWSVEIYKGYGVNSYKKIFYTDGHTSRKSAIKKALKYINKKTVNVYKGREKGKIERLQITKSEKKKRLRKYANRIASQINNSRVS